MNSAKITARWAFNVSEWNPSDKQYNQTLLCVQPEESERIKRFKFFNDSKLALAGRLLTRYLFCKVYECDWREIRLGRTKENKPILLKPKALIGGNKYVNFNISHHGNWVVLVAGENCQIGVDVAEIEKFSNKTIQQMFEIFKDQFSEHELSVMTTPQEESQQLHMFYRHWCLKESYVKAVGVGLATNLKSIEFHLSDEERENFFTVDNSKIINTKTTVYINNKPQRQWKFEEMYLDELHLVGIAYCGLNNCEDCSNIEIDGFNKIELEELLKYSKEL
ncbi:8559_t:CDS:2 [Acaulospora morrowiae]|uniref:holo-[acyl-carrier-protein] synthase n=1 Tax=Acaulospora morrowiae TaxID=94023 RepID=A0A9N8ZKE9_9GLOM|nr:8559_t:CDS:2 [Acaulospora morrowiae]